MPMYHLIEFSDDYSKTSGRFWEYYRNELFLDVNAAIADFPADSKNSVSFKFETKIVGRKYNNDTKKAMLSLKYL